MQHRRSEPLPPDPSDPPKAKSHACRSGLRRVWGYVWALPNTLLGMLFVLPTLLSGGGVHLVQGVVEIHGGVAALFLRYCTLLRGGASAMTLGHVVLGKTPWLLNATRDHERVHVRQAERWGPLFVPAYLLSSLIIYFRGGRPYLDNPFEREAYRSDAEREDPPEMNRFN